MEQTVLLVGPLIAVSTLVAWWMGGRLWLAVVWVAVSAWMLARSLHGAGAYDALARGWAIVLVSVFGVVNVVSGRRPFLTRALSTLGVTFAVAAAVVLVSNVSPSRVERTLSDELSRRLAAWNDATDRRSQTPEWQRFSADHPEVARFVEENEARAKAPGVRNTTLLLFPALLALESLVALALAWGLVHRISRTRVGPPFTPLRQFRLNDQMVWGFLAGLAMTVIPALAAVRSLGLNLVVFFGTLYALGGLGVLAWFVAPRPRARVALVLLAVVFWPVIGLVALISLGLGLADTWIDWRGRLRPLT